MTSSLAYTELRGILAHSKSMSSAVSKRAMELKHVLLCHRHGDRAPIYTDLNNALKHSDEEIELWKTLLADKNDIQKLLPYTKIVGVHPNVAAYKDPVHGGQYPGGNLTMKGLMQMIEKGKELWKRYHKLFSHDVKHTELVYATSTNYYRTIQSVQALLYGMFEEKKAENDASAVSQFYICTHKVEKMIPPHTDALYDDMQTLYLSDLDTKSQERILAIEKRVRDTLGYAAEDVVNWTSVRDVLTCKKSHNIPWPKGVTQEMYEEIVAADAALWYHCFSHKGLGAKFFSNGVEELLSHLHHVLGKRDDPILKDRPIPKISVFSAHDCTLVSLVNALHLDTSQRLPDYGTVIAFEIYQSTDETAKAQHFIKVVWDEKELFFEGFEAHALISFEDFEQIAAKNL